MIFDKEKTLLIADYIARSYDDKSAHAKLEAFLLGLDIGRRDAIAQAANYVNNWHTHMDSLHESCTKGLIKEIEDGILELEFGDN